MNEMRTLCDSKDTTDFYLNEKFSLRTVLDPKSGFNGVNS